MRTINSFFRFLGGVVCAVVVVCGVGVWLWFVVRSGGLCVCVLGGGEWEGGSCFVSMMFE